MDNLQTDNNTDSIIPVTDNFDNSKLSVLLHYLENTPDIEQHSEKWFDIRKTSVGGSEINKLLTIKSVLTLISEKQDINKSFPSAPATRWGTILEDCTLNYVELVLNTKIYKKGSVEGFITNQRYSPDGLCVYNNQILLLEFKTPYTRIPTGVISKDYMAQVQTGLFSIPITEKCLFVENVYRICSLTDFKYKDLNYIPTRDFIEFKKVLSYGILIIKGIPVDNTVKDLSEINEDVFYKIHTKEYDVEYYPQIIPEDITQFKDYKKTAINHINNLVTERDNNTDEYNKVIIGFICYKLFESSQIFIERDPEYKDLIIKKMEEFNSLLKDPPKPEPNVFTEFIIN